MFLHPLKGGLRGEDPDCFSSVRKRRILIKVGGTIRPFYQNFDSSCKNLKVTTILPWFLLCYTFPNSFGLFLQIIPLVSNNVKTDRHFVLNIFVFPNIISVIVLLFYISLSIYFITVS